MIDIKDVKVGDKIILGPNFETIEITGIGPDHNGENYISTKGLATGRTDVKYPLSFLNKINAKHVAMSGGWNLKTPTNKPPSPVPPQSFKVGDRVRLSNGSEYTIVSPGTVPGLWDCVDDSGALNMDLFEGVLTLVSHSKPTGIFSQNWGYQPPTPTLDEAKEMWGLKAALVPPSPPNNPLCVIVKSQALGKEFLYCKTHDDEADFMYCCRKAALK